MGKGRFTSKAKVSSCGKHGRNGDLLRRRPPPPPRCRDPHPSNGDKDDIYTALWHACAGSFTSIPKTGDWVFYFPQGHLEQMKAFIDLEGDIDISAYNIPYKILCKVVNIQLKADATDQVYACITLIPEAQLLQDEPSPMVDENSLPVPRRPSVKSFCKRLTQSDTSTHGGFTVHKRHAEEILPPLDMAAEKPTQELVAKDLNGVEWRISHTFRGNPKRHLLTTGWSSFLTSKRLVPGDVFIFLRGDNREFRVGVRRATTEMATSVASVISAQTMQLGILAAASRAICQGTVFHVIYHPWICPEGFLVPFDQYMRSTDINYSVGSRFHMLFEGQDCSEQRIGGTIVAIEDEDHIRWPNSEWRSLKVRCDPLQDALSPPERVSPWNIQVVEPVKRKRPASLQPPNKARIVGMPGSPSTSTQSGVFHTPLKEPKSVSEPALQDQERNESNQAEEPDTKHVTFPPGCLHQKSSIPPWVGGASPPLINPVGYVACNVLSNSLSPALPQNQEAQGNAPGNNNVPVPSAKSHTSGSQALQLRDLNTVPPASPEEADDKHRLFGVNLSDNAHELPSPQVPATSDIDSLEVVLISSPLTSQSSVSETSSPASEGCGC